MMKPILSTLVLALLAQSISPAAPRKTRDQQVIEDRDTLRSNDTWIYNDLGAAKKAATAAKKPLMVVFRCIP
jgi:hypothetical protein